MTKTKNTIILTGPIRTGKTTSIISWSKKQKSVMGITQPVIDGKRCLLDLKSGKTVSLEADSSDTDIIKVGMFRFKESSFEWAKEILLNAAAQKPEWIIVDEYGKLELDNQGLEPVVTKLTHNKDILQSSKLVIIIRDYLLKDALAKLNLVSEEVGIVESPEKL